MNIVLVSTRDISGGAARASYRLHKGFQHIGQSSTLIAQQKDSSDNSVLQVISHPQTEGDRPKASGLDAIQNYIHRNRSELSNTLFSFPYPGVDLSHIPDVQTADVINLHWVAQFQSPSTLEQLLNLGKPVVWTLHDMAAFTGGCHYGAGCLKYQSDCSGCPQLAQDPYRLAAATLEDKLQRFADKPNLTIVTPSRWLADCAQSSRLLRNRRIEVIPYSLETDVFVPLNKSEAKAHLNIAPHVTTLLFGAVSAKEDRKGFFELVQALWRCLDEPQFRQKVEAQHIEILCFGTPSEWLEGLDIPVRSLGKVESDAELSRIYSAADVFVLPSLQDNFPNTMLEAMSCGTPVIGFDSGGISDVVIEGETGYLVPLRDVAKLAEALMSCIFNPDSRIQMGRTCRQRIESDYHLPIQAQAYVHLFQDLQGVEAQLTPSYPDVHPDVQSSDMSDFSSSNPESSADQSSPSPVADAPIDLTVGQSLSPVVDELSFRAIATSLHQTKDDLQRLRLSYQQQRDVAEQRQSERDQSRDQLRHTQKQLQDTQAKLKHVSILLRNTEETLEQSKIQVEKVKLRHDQTLAQLQLTQQQLRDYQAKLMQQEKPARKQPR
ncbi:MAG: glycosyltransferase family 4 protein [Elainellaceae cyanobacterium]